ncbi:RsmB/NOP family class I SAM-dependent RNA methyltransferase [Terasakiella sp. A23]|uniref:RsmB/NOP family class I SAM-dependent RNA methyltransferase n=1 Tax=Terasakiella sp. FCG-A23 TaxID=3080561 RepID=UPI0029547C1C|nr:RsmB/NOP family class I SAM-dependent RNA methyltransferase [Terasakiella sp. A23]MDV7339220.1 RsmB/NOP family class I SAM-dependent RNA methyltransferase [Terasakiella sp. A23]
MKPSARIQSVIEILTTVFDGKRPADAVIADYFKARRYAGSKDRRAINDQVYRILRNRAKLNWLANKVESTSGPRILTLIDCVQNDLDIENLFTGDQYAPEALSDFEKGLVPVLAQFDTNDAPDPIRLEYPDWLDDDLRASLGDDFEDVLNALNEEAPLDLRINALHENANEAAQLLAKQNIETVAGLYSPLCLRTKKKVKLGGIQAYKEGLVDVQDEGSQLIALLSQAKDCELVMDFCAGGGGKTLALAAEMENQGALYALDISSTRLYKMKRRLERAGITNVHLNPIKSENDPWLKQFEMRVDRLLIDAPCSGLGAWRRNPESRWKLSAEMLEDMLGRQERILENAAHLVKPGGQVIYATCSLLKRENEDQIAKFLKKNDNFAIKPVGDIWEERFGTDCPFDGDFMTMRPDLHKSDGFFCAILERTN